MLASTKDQLVPPEHMEEMFVLAQKRITNGETLSNRFVSFSVGTHNDIPMAEPTKYYAAWKSFLSERGCFGPVGDKLVSPIKKFGTPRKI